MLDANRQRSRLLKAALAGEEVIIASEVNAAFEEAVDQQVAELLNSCCACCTTPR